MMTVALSVGVGGFAMIALGVAILSWRAILASRQITTTGTVTDLSQRSSGEFPIVTFVDDASGRSVTFVSNFSADNYRIGQTLPVYYDPRNPAGATIMSARSARFISLILIGSALVLLAYAAVLAFWLAPAEAARDRAVDDFLSAARRNDRAAIRAASADGASFDDELIEHDLRPSQEFKAGNSAGGSSDFCIRGVLLPQKTEIVFYLVAVRGKWKVRRVARTDPECDARVD